MITVQGQKREMNDGNVGCVAGNAYLLSLSDSFRYPITFLLLLRRYFHASSFRFSFRDVIQPFNDYKPYECIFNLILILELL